MNFGFIFYYVPAADLFLFIKANCVQQKIGFSLFLRLPAVAKAAPLFALPMKIRFRVIVVVGLAPAKGKVCAACFSVSRRIHRKQLYGALPLAEHNSFFIIYVHL